MNNMKQKLFDKCGQEIIMNFYSDSVEKLLYVLPKEEHGIDKIKEILKKHREVRFVSFVAMDFSGNGTDEKIPVETFLSNIESMLKNGIQTDGSGVVLQKIATLEDAKVVIIPDIDAYWYVDYNFTSLDDTGEIPVGTLRIPSFLSHNNKYVCSRSILKHAIERIKKETFDFMYHHPSILRELNITHASIEDVYLTLATELEFWVSTPDDIVDEEKLSASQELKEQYWKHTDGEVRSALEDVLTVMDLYGFEPEMGHKEVGGVTSKISVNGKSEHVMEQLEVDWKYDNPMDTADKEHFIRHLIKDIFHLHKLEVTFRAKPVEGVAGSGKHLHIGVGLNLKDKNKVNLYSYNGNEKHYMTSYGYGALMGILKNYEVINPFIAWTNDSMNRLKPDFEAPVCIVASLGNSINEPSRNRSVLIGLIKENNNPLSTRFELRSPNPHNNVYIITAACYQCMIDGLKNSTMKNPLYKIEEEFSKKEGDDSSYLEKHREYRSEKNIFSDYTPEERERKFGKPVNTVYENMMNFKLYPHKVEVLKADDVFTDEIIDSFTTAMIEKWENQIKHRIIPDNMKLVKSYSLIKSEENNITDIDSDRWQEISALRCELLKDSSNKKSIFTTLKENLDDEKYLEASELLLVMNEKMQKLKELYTIYKRNIF